MESLLSGFAGKKLEINCGSNVVYRGEVVTAQNGILRLKNEEGHVVYLAIDKISAVSECREFANRPGFIA
jgi:hypothetical protein